jgi:hypothetical protein
VIVVGLPTGTVTLLFTDIEGSTRMLPSPGEDDGRVLRAHRAILRQGERPRAYGLLSETLSLLRAWSERTELAETLEILATLAAQEGEVERVVRLLGRALTFDQALDSAAAWADQRSRGST